MDSSPGPDGIPYSFLKHFWPVIGPIILKAWAYSLEQGVLPPSHKLSYLKLIPKAGKDSRMISNLRPITLSNTDHKLITKTYAKKLTSIVDCQIEEGQTAYIPGRLINDNIRSLLMAIDLAEVDDSIDGVMVSLDAKKAFDSVDHRYIRKCLEAFGLGNFVKIFDILYKDLSSDIIINGSTVKGYKILRGVKQGDALSCILFIMCIEPLLKNIKANDRIRPISTECLPIEIPKSYGFADDITVLGQRSIESVQEIFNEYEKFTRASGLTLNADKTEILCFNAARQTNHQFEVTYLDQRYVITSMPRVKVNGIIFLQDARQREIINVRKSTEAMEKLLRAWSTRSLTLLGRILIIKTYAVSQVIFLMQSMKLTEASYKSIDRVLFKYLWNRNFNASRAPDRIKRKVMYTPTSLGGFGMLNVRELADSLDLRSYARLMVSNHPFLKGIKTLIDSGNFFNIRVNAPVDQKLRWSVELLNRKRLKIIDWPIEVILASTNLVSVLSEMKLTQLLTPAGRRSISYFMIHRRVPNVEVRQLRLTELSSVARQLAYPRLRPILEEIIRRRQAVQGNIISELIYPTKSKTLVSIGTLSSKTLRMDSIDEEDQMICLFKLGIALTPGELARWTSQMKKLTSTRHKNILLRLAHGDIFSNGRLHRFNLRETASCSNCAESNESILHRVIECPTAREAWRLLEEAKVKLGFPRLTDTSIESVLGLKDRIGKIELALHAELILKLTSISESYCPVRLVKAAVKLIGYSERLDPALKSRFNQLG